MSVEIPAPVLSETDVAVFERDGFVVLRDAFSPETMAELADWADDLARRPEEIGKHWVFHEQSLTEQGRRLISRIENIAPFHDGFARLNAVLAKTVAGLLGEEAVLFKEKINYKMPGGDGFKPHQDSQAGWDAYANYFVTVALSLDDSTLENGCLRFAPGNQGKRLFRSWEPLTEADMAGMAFADYPTRRGDLVLFDSFVPHASEPNRSDRIRRIYYATYNRRSEGDHLARYYADKRKSYPPDIEREAGREYVFRV